jgi:hypothetical protein
VTLSSSDSFLSYSAAHLFDPGPTIADHPAKFTPAILGEIARHLEPGWRIIDPFAGVGGIHTLRDLVPGLATIGIEIEPGWARAHPDTVCADTFTVDFPAGAFDAVVTSCTYGNRLADHHNNHTDWDYNTYQHRYGQALHPNNSGLLQWGPKYRDFHERAWAHTTPWARRFILNIKDHQRRGKQVPVVAWHREALTLLGFTLVNEEEVEAPGYRRGANRAHRYPEMVLVFDRPTAPKGGKPHD